MCGAVNKCQQTYGLDTPDKAFPYYILSLMFSDEGEELEDLITDGGNDRGIDAIKISKQDGYTDIHVFQFKYRNTHDNSRKNFPDEAVDKVISFFKALFDEDSSLENSCNPFLWQKVQEIWASINEASTRFTLHFCTNGQNLIPTQKERLLRGLQAYSEVEALRMDTNTALKKGVIAQADTFLTYGQFHILYLVSILSEKTKLDISRAQNRKRLINDALNIIRNYVSDRKSHSYYTLFRNPKTKQDLYDLVFQRGQLEFQLTQVQERQTA